MLAALKAAEISGLMLTYLGHSAAKHELLDLSEICRRSLPLLQAAAINGIVIKANLPFPGPIIKADVNQIQQILTNLTTNARESIDENQGAINLTVKTVSSIDISEINRFPINWQSLGSNYACLEVTDAGCGIANEDIDKLFDPFFSSKFTGRGLGLSVVLGIVKAHEGAITVESEKGRGSIFRVFLPMSMDTLPGKSDKTTQHLANERGGTVLLVDDEDMLREMIKNMLMRLGFTVFTASDGIEAVEVYRQHQDEICCVICDLTMPLMGGYETVKALKVITPHVKVILSSGYTKEQATEHFAGLEPAGFIQKPYSQKELAAEIWKALDGK
jgi:CheY-like chemotaxis protein